MKPALRADLQQLKRALREAWRSLWFAVRPARQIRGQQLKLNLGCGPLGRPGWINIDSFPVDAAVHRADLRNPLPLADGSVAHIHCEHCLEHVDFDAALRLLAECFRVLAPGGSLRLILPDAGKYMRAYAAGDQAFFAATVNIGNPSVPFATPVEIVNQSFRMGGAHLYAWDEVGLRHHLERIGFVDLQTSRMHEVSAELDIDGTDDWRGVESLYLNLRKPLPAQPRP